jgi:hypothetical protein
VRSSASGVTNPHHNAERQTTEDTYDWVNTKTQKLDFGMLAAFQKTPGCKKEVHPDGEEPA